MVLRRFRGCTYCGCNMLRLDFCFESWNESCAEPDDTLLPPSCIAIVVPKKSGRRFREMWGFWRLGLGGIPENRRLARADSIFQNHV